MLDTITVHDQMGKNGFVWFHGVVEDINDPLKMGRVRVRCFEFHNADKELLPTQDLPWATPLLPVTSASVSGKGISPTGLLQGSWVIGFFRDGVNCQDPVVLGSFVGKPDPIEGTTGQYSDPSLGFNDPEGKWPSKEYGGEADTNRLTRNEKIEKTIVQKKREEAKVGVQTALHPWLTWDEKVTDYDPKYPKNHVMETESGHVIELDDTPDKERISVYHKAGTWIELHPDGSRVERIRGDDYEVAMSDKKLLVQGNCFMNIDGPITTLKTGKDFYIEINGDLRMLARGNVVMETGKNFEHRVHGTYTVASDGNMSFVAPRIDFNPEGVAVNLASSPGLATGKNPAPLLQDATVFPGRALPLDQILQGQKDKYLSTDYFKKLHLRPKDMPVGLDAFKSYYESASPNAATIPWDQTGKAALTQNVPVKGDQWWKDVPASEAKAAIPSTLPDGTVIKTEKMPQEMIPSEQEIADNNKSLMSESAQEAVRQNNIAQLDDAQIQQTQTNLSQQNQQLSQTVAQTQPTQAVVSGTDLGVSPGAVQGGAGEGLGFPLLQDEVGGFLGGVGEAVGGAIEGVQAVLPEGLDLGGLGGVASGALLGGALGPVGTVVGGAFAGALAFVNPALASQAVNIAANVSTATVPSPASYLNVTPEGITNLSATPLPPVSAGIAGQTITDTNLVDIGAPGLPTESLYAVPGGTATVISGYPGRAAENSAAGKGIPAIPIITFETQFPSMKPTPITEVDGGEF
jgi:hypothetical protein